MYIKQNDKRLDLPGFLCSGKRCVEKDNIQTIVFANAYHRNKDFRNHSIQIMG